MIRHHWLALPRLIRFMLRHFANGVILGWTCGLAVIWLDIGGIGSLLASFDSAGLTALFFFKGGLLFGAVAMSVAVMNLGSDET
jgi:hypothetical protein